MKISKLFHWLYAIVMLLPIFAIGTTCLISTFNMSSKQESVVNYKYETNDVNSASDLVVGNLYHYEVSLVGIGSNFCECYGFYDLNSNSDISFLSREDSYIYVSQYGSSTDAITVVFNNTFSESYIYRLSDNKFIAEVIFKTLSNNDDYTRYSISNYVDNIIKSVDTNNIDTQDIFYNAIDKVKQSPLFSWAYESFLVAPFAYIVSLFSMPANSFVVQMLSYWLAISIIWLVFDLVMYVPLLVHRWLDKGVLE